MHEPVFSSALVKRCLLDPFIAQSQVVTMRHRARQVAPRWLKPYTAFRALGVANDACTTSAAWSRSVSSPCYTKHGQRCGVILSGRITTIAMSMSGQLGLHCTVEPNCSGTFIVATGAAPLWFFVGGALVS
jgi:hypothetical protein